MPDLINISQERYQELISQKWDEVFNDLVSIPKSEHDRLCKRDQFLQNLEDAGVDNWDGYHYGFGDDLEEESYENIYGD